MEEYSPIVLKLQLLCQGVRIDPDIDSGAVGKDIKEPLRQRAGVGSGGLDMILPEKVYCGAPVYEAFVKNSPFTLKKKRFDYIIEKNGRPIQKVAPFPRPAYYKKKCSDGTPMQRIGTIQGDTLGVSIDNRCFFWGHYKGDKMEVYKGNHCKYCAIGLNLDVTEEPRKTIDQVLEVSEEALKEDVCRHVSLNAGCFPPPDTGHEVYAEFVRALKDRLDEYVRLSIVPPLEEKYVDIMLDSGCDLTGYNYEIFDPDLYKKICPGKFREIDKGVAHQTYDRMLQYGTKRAGKNMFMANLLAGLEPRESTVAGIEHLASMGVVPRIFVFRALTSTLMENHPMPKPEDLVYIYRHLKEICEEKYCVYKGCPGCARVEVGTVRYLGIVPHMKEITDDDLMVAGIDPEATK